MIRRKRVFLLIGLVISLALFVLPRTSKLKLFTINDDSHFINRIEIPKFNSLDLDAKCTRYFDYFLDHDISTEYSQYVFEPSSLEDFLNEKIKKFKNENPDSIDRWKQEFYKNTNEHSKILKKLQNQTIDTRIFGHCFLRPHFFNDTDRCAKVSKKLFPWLTGKYPDFERYDGSKFSGSDGGNSCLLQNIVSKSNGKGIVLTATNAHFNNLASLILALRALQNTLPMQVVMKNDFAASRRETLFKLARLDIDQIIKEQIPLKNDILLNDYSKKFTQHFPRQNITFINVKESIEKKSMKLFKSYTFKLLAAIFNTFEEVVIMDADVIPFIAPQDFLELQEYKQTGAFFFKDRTLINRSSKLDIAFWKSLMPSAIESSMFSIPQIFKSLQNRYFKSFTHQMEAGVVLMNRKEHFPGIIQSAQLAQWKTATKRVWGDKELFWLSQSISGNENYTFNNNFAGAIGRVETDSETKDYTFTRVCSAQPAHVYNDSLLWINSGFDFCKNKGAARTDSKAKGGKPTADELDALYKGPIDVKAVLIPPNIDDFYVKNNLNERIANEIPDTIRSWENTPDCAGYIYCAVSPLKIEGKLYNGTLLQFTEEQSKDYNYLGNLWLHADNLVKPLSIRNNNAKFAMYLDI